MLKRDKNCTLCKLHQTAEYVCLLGQGPKRCDVMIVGEAPGRREDGSGKPFVGQSGQLLEEVLKHYGLDRKDIYITNAVSCRPPDNRTPKKQEIAACKVWLERQIKEVKPKFVLLLGNTPLLSVTGESGIRKKRGKPFEKEGIVYMPTYHPRDVHGKERFTWERDIKEFTSLIEYGGIPREKNLNYTLVKTRKQFEEMLDALDGEVSLDIETTGLYPWAEDARIVTLGFGCEDAQYILPMEHEECPWPGEGLLEMLEEIGDRLDDCDIITQNGKFDFLYLWVRFKLRWYKYHRFDTMLAHYILDENDWHDLEHLAIKYLGAPKYDVDLETKQGKHGLEKTAHYQAHDLLYTRQLKFKFEKMLWEDGQVKKVFDKILMPCSRLFTEVEYDGVKIDISKMDAAEKYLKKELMKARIEMESYGELENWGSPKQLAEFLFGPKKEGGLGLEIIERTKKGAISTSESVIKRIEHPIGPAIIKYRGAKQQLSFFIDGWKPYIVNEILHPSFKLHGTVTGRLSCEHPNLQQVPRDTRIRELITAPDGWTLIECDLSQIELRIAAELAQERTMLQAFHTGVDVHWLTATRELERGGGGKHVDTIIRTAEAFLKKQGKPKKLKFPEAMEIVQTKISPGVAEELQKEWNETDPEMLWKEIRKKAKAVNFGYLYGMWWKKFKIYARDNYGVTLTDEQAESSREFFFATFPDFEKWHRRQRRYANLNGYVRSLSGRKRRLPAAMSPVDTPERREAERQAINSPVQSFANELNLMAAIQLRKEYPRTKVRLCGTVHDALLAWVKNEHVEEVVRRLLEIMSHPDLLDVFDIELGVPVLAEAKIGPWGKGMSLEKWVKREA